MAQSSRLQPPLHGSQGWRWSGEMADVPMLPACFDPCLGNSTTPIQGGSSHFKQHRDNPPTGQFDLDR